MTEYKLQLDCSPLAKRLAHLYHTSPQWKVPSQVKALFIEQVLAARQLMPVGISFVHVPDDIYGALPELLDDIKKTGQMKVRWLGGGHHPLGPVHTDFRAVHDYFGHVLGCNEFTFQGELAAWEIHKASTMFSRETLPLVWSEVVLENAYRVWHGHWYWHSKPVFDERWGDRSDE